MKTTEVATPDAGDMLEVVRHWLPAVPTREQILKLEALAVEHLPPVPIGLRHYLADGIYAREMSVSKGSFVSGLTHRKEHVCVVSKGRIVVWTEDGMREVAAPFTMVTKPGAKRVGVALEDTVWTTFHATSLTNLDDIEREMIEEDPALLLRGHATLREIEA